MTPNTPSDICNSLLGLFDRCYKHEAFIDAQRHVLLQWRGRLSAMLQTLGKIEFKKIQSTYNHTQQRRDGKLSVRPTKSTIGLYHASYSSNSIPLAKFNSEPQNNSLMDPGFPQRLNRSPTQMYPTVEEPHDSNSLQTAFANLTSTPQRNNGAYLANNQHQTLIRKASIGPYGEASSHDKPKLCKTVSDPNRARFYNPSQVPNMQLSSMRAHQAPQHSLFQMISTPYSQQQRAFVSRSPPTSTTDTSTSPIKECFPDDERSDYYGKISSATRIAVDTFPIDIGTES